MRRQSPGCARTRDGGFALLVIFLIAAAVAFTMYQELPRAAFESARDKEQLLMDRGNQYKRAIQVYYAENKRYPAELKDLETAGNKRYLRRRYIDPMTGQDEWRLIHTNGSFLTDSLVKKPPQQNAGDGLPGGGQRPGGGPLGSNNLNTDPAAATANGAAAAAGAAPAPLNAAAQRRPSDRGFPTGPGFPQPPGSDPNNPNVGGANPFGANPGGAYDPSDPRTWPAITIATPTPTGQPGQPQQSAGRTPFNTQPVGAQTGGRPLFGGGAPGVTGQVPGQQVNAPFGITQPQPQFGAGQLGGIGGANPFNQNPLAGNGPAAAVNQNNGQVPDPIFGQPPMPPANQTATVQQTPPFGVGQTPNNGQVNIPPAVTSQAANLAANGFNPQAPVSSPNPFPTGVQPNSFPTGAQANPFSPGAQPNQFPTGAQPNPFPTRDQPNPFPTAAQPSPFATGAVPNQVVPGAQPNPALPGNTTGNAALNAIDNALFRPNQAPLGGPTGGPGIAGVASKFKGPSIKTYKERTKYQEWEFIYEPAMNVPGQAGGAGQNPLQNQNGPGQGQNGPGQNGFGFGPSSPGQNGLGPNGTGQSGPGQGSGQTGTPTTNPFSMPNPFAPPSGPTR